MNDKKTVLVTGGSRGIGKAIAQRLARDGYHVLINYRSRRREAEETKAQIAQSGGSAEICPFDIADPNATAHALEEICKRLQLYGLVLSAGIHDDALLVFMNEDQWNSVLDTNLGSFYHVTRPAVRQMLLNRKGRIVAITSTSGQSGLPGQVNYAASKAGVIGAVKALALECARRNVLINAIAPGFIETEMTGAVDAQEKSALIPMKRFGTPREVAGAASFLLSEDASYITGQVISVNGGVYL